MDFVVLQLSLLKIISIMLPITEDQIRYITLNYTASVERIAGEIWYTRTYRFVTYYSTIRV